jgi:hypothetical protein
MLKQAIEAGRLDQGLKMSHFIALVHKEKGFRLWRAVSGCARMLLGC